MEYGTPQGYRAMEVLSMSPAQRIVFLFARLHTMLVQAQGAIDREEIETRERRLDDAAAVVHELAMSLDRHQGGDLADRLAALYAWILTECQAVHTRPDRARLEVVRRIVAELHEAWRGAAAQVAVGSAG
jgi:flagellar secretion chaperone FliS